MSLCGHRRRKPRLIIIGFTVVVKLVLILVIIMATTIRSLSLYIYTYSGFITRRELLQVNLGLVYSV